MNKKMTVSALAIALVVLLVSMREPLLRTVFEKGLEARLGNDLMQDLEDGLHLALCGAGGPLPAPNASGPCVAVIAGQRLFVVDAGTDGLRNLGRMGFPTGRIESVFITHFHSDHIDGLGELATIRWVSAANQTPLPVFGPTGIGKVVEGFNMAYQFDQRYRHQHHGDTVAPVSGWGMGVNEFMTPQLGQLETLIDGDDLVVEAFAVGHAPVVPAVGYRFSYKGRSLLISGDTVASDNVREFSRGIDLLVHEALAPNLVMQMHEVAKRTGNSVFEKVTLDILDYHASPMEAAQLAKEANVGHLLYYHIVPPLVMPGQKELFLDGADDVFSNYTIGNDGLMFSLPVGSKEINLVRDGL